MRKIFTSLKSVVSAVVIAAMAFSVSCSYDDAAINNRVDKVENDLKALTERVDALEKKLGTEVESLKALIDGKVVIVEVTTDEAGNTTIKLSDGKTITVLAAEDTLQYRVVDGVLEVSADGENWVAVEVAPEQVVADVVLNEDGTVTVKLANGDEFTVVKAELIECEAASNGVYIPAGESKEIALSINDAVVDINIMNQPLGWSASIEEAPEAPEDEGGAIAPMPLAAGGKNYVVKINAPAASFKEAANEGVVSVHFNTAAGACKVLSVNVNLAKLTFDIDKDGNITIVNSLIEMKRSMIWGDHEGFANFFIGIVYKSDYEDFGGNLQSIMNYGFPISFNQHDNLAFFNKEYEPGVYEEEVVTFTVQELLDEFKSVGMSDVSLEYGNEYVIYIAKTNSVGEQDFNNLLVAADYKALQVAAEKVEGSETWNGADYKFTILGYEFAIIGYVPQREVDQLIEFGQCSDLDSFYDFYIANAENYGYPNIGSLVELGYEPWNEYLLPANQLSQMYKPIAPNTEYRLYALCFNYDDFMSGRAFNHEDIYDFGTFTTTDLKAGDFDVIESTELVSWDAMGVKANIYLTDDVQLSYYKSFDEATLDQASRIEEMLADAYFEGVSEFTIYEYVGDATEIYVGVIAVNANGEYAYEEVVFKKNATEEPETPAGDEIVALSAAARYDSNNSYATIVDFALPNNEIASVAFRTGDGGWDLDLCFTKGFNYINAGQWTTYSDKGSSNVWYTNAYLNGEYATIDGIITVSYVDDAYGFKFKINDYNVTYTGAVEGLVAPQVTGDGLPKEEAVDRSNISFVYCEDGGASVFGGYSTVSLIGNDGKNYIRLEFNSPSNTPENGVTYTFDPADTSYANGTLSGNGVWIGYNGFVDSGYYSDAIPQSGTVAVTVAGDVYTFVLDFTLPDGSKFAGTFEGAIPFN